MSLESIVQQLKGLDSAIIDGEKTSVLHGRISTMIDHIAGMRTKESELGFQLDVLRADLEHLTSENANLKAQIKAFEERTKGFKDEQLKILKFVFDEGRDFSWEEIPSRFQIQKSVADYHIAKLFQAELLRQTIFGVEGFGGYQPPMFGITQKGREFVMERL